MNGIAFLMLEHPGLVLKALIGSLVAFGLFVWAASPSHEERRAYQAEIEAHDRAKLECRKSGGSFEYFGTEGYHCIGGEK